MKELPLIPSALDNRSYSNIYTHSMVQLILISYDKDPVKTKMPLLFTLIRIKMVLINEIESTLYGFNSIK
jgi:hypothetical protein